MAGVALYRCPAYSRRMELKARSKMFAHHADEVRESWWRLIQAEDGALYVDQEATYRDGEHKQRTVQINDFLRENGPPPRVLQTLIDRMFED
jgi:hypothetical protein